MSANQLSGLFASAESGIINVLMTGGGAPGAAGIIRCLAMHNKIRIIAADKNEQAAGRYLAHDFVKIPAADDLTFILSLLSICREKNIHVLMPLVTRELIPLAAHRKDFEMAGAQLLVSSVESLEIANNKSRLYEFLQWRGIPVPAFRVVENVAQFSEAISALGYPEKTVCFKPAVSNGSRGFRILDASIDESDLLFNYKPSATYMRQADAKRILSAAPFPELLVSEYLPGPEFSVDCLCRQGETILAVPRRRTKMINGISVEGVFEEQPEITDYCRTIIKELRLDGNIGIQVKQASNGQYLLLEINPRVQGTISAALGAGINLPLLAVKQALDLPVAPEELQVKWGTRFIRFWDEVFY